MSGIDAPESSTVHLRGEGNDLILLIPISVVVLILSIGRLYFGLVVDRWNWSTEQWVLGRAVIRTGLSLLITGFLWQSWRSSVVDLTLSSDSLIVSTRAKQTVFALNELLSCEIFVRRSFIRIAFLFVLKKKDGTERVELFLSRRLHPLQELKLLPALQQRGVELIDHEFLLSELERLTKRSAHGLFNRSGLPEAGKSA